MASVAQSEAGPSRSAACLPCPRRSASLSRRSSSRPGRTAGDAQEHHDAYPLPTWPSSPSSLSVATSPSSSSSSSSSPSRRRMKPSPTARASASALFLPLFATLALVLAALTHLPLQAAAQVAEGEANNVTSLRGTWSSGSGRVSTGVNFYNPVNTSFNPPTVAGQSYSFTDDGYWEQALYIYSNNAARPSCVSAQLVWQHGTYTLNANNSLTLTPFNGDGRQVIEDRCSSTSTTSAYYYQPEFMLGFDIVLDVHHGKTDYRLQLYEWDGALKSLMWQIYNPPQMLPTELLVQELYGATS